MYTHIYIFSYRSLGNFPENLSPANKDVRGTPRYFRNFKIQLSPDRVRHSVCYVLEFSLGSCEGEVSGSGRTKQEKFIVLRGVNTMFRASWQRRVADNVAGLHAETAAL